MRIINWAFCLLATTATAVYAQDAPPDYVAPMELIIDTTHMPAVCTAKASAGDTVNVHYTGTLHATGVKFDSSHDRGKPLPLTLGRGQVIKGWDEGLLGMCVGEKRKLTIPANKAYGASGFGSIIPANSALVFDTELVGLDSVHDEL